MSPFGSLTLLLQDDGDVVVFLRGRDSVGDPAQAEVEFCDPGAGGGRSPSTLKALRALAVAIQEDEATLPYPPGGTPSPARSEATARRRLSLRRHAAAAAEALNPGLVERRNAWPADSDVAKHYQRMLDDAADVILSVALVPALEP